MGTAKAAEASEGGRLKELRESQEQMDECYFYIRVVVTRIRSVGTLFNALD